MRTTFSLLAGLFFLFHVAQAQNTTYKTFEFQGRYEVFVNGNTLLQPQGKSKRWARAWRKGKSLLYQTNVDIDPYTYASNAIQVTVPDSTTIVGAYIVWAANYSYCFVSKNKNDGTLTTLEPAIKKKNTVKFKTPFSNKYMEYKYQTLVNNDVKGDESFKPSVHYVDVTKVFSKQKRISGQYWLADFNSIQGNSPEGLSAGWSLMFVYESPKAENKFISGVIGWDEVNEGKLKHDNVVNTFEGQVNLPYTLTLFSLSRSMSKTQSKLFWEHNEQSMLLNKSDQKNFFQGKIQSFGTRLPSYDDNFGVDLMTIKNQFSSPFFPFRAHGLELNVETKNNTNVIYTILEVPVNVRYREKEEEQEQIQEEVVKVVDTVTVVPVQPVAFKKKQKPIVKSNDSVNGKPVSPIRSKRGKTKRTPKVTTYKMKGMTPGYYIVNGVFRVDANRDSWMKTIKYSGFTIDYFVLPRNKWNYIYCYHNASYQEAFKKLKEVRRTTFFNNSWIIKIEN